MVNPRMASSTDYIKRPSLPLSLTPNLSLSLLPELLDIIYHDRTDNISSNDLYLYSSNV